MNKKVSKTLAAVLSAAMAASAFAMSTSASFAASVSAGQATATPVAVAVDTENDQDGTYTLAENASDLFVASFTVDGRAVRATSVDFTKGSKWKSSNENIATVDGNGKVTIDAAYVSGVQTVTFTRSLDIGVTTETDKHNHTEKLTATVTGSVTMYIYPVGTKLILPDGAEELTGDYIAPVQTISMNEPADFDVYTVSAASANDSSAVYTDGATDDAGKAYTFTDNSSAIDIDTTEGSFEPDNQNPVTGRATINAVDSNGDVDRDVVSATLTIEDSYKVLDNSMYIEANKKANYGDEVQTITTDNWDVTDTDIVVEGARHLYVISGEIGDIEGDAKSAVTVYGGTMGDITSGTVNIQPNSSNDNIDIATGNITSDGSVTIDGDQRPVNNVYASVSTGDISASNVTLSAYDNNDKNAPEAEGTVSVGDVTASGEVFLTAGQYINTMTIGDLSGVEGNYDDCPYTATLVVNKGTFDLGDLPYFGSVTVEVNANVTAGAIATGTQDDINTSKCGAVSDSQLLVKGKLNAQSIEVDTIDSSSDGEITVPADSLIIMSRDQVKTGATLIVDGVKKGDVLYSTVGQKADLFNIPGVTAVEAQGSGNTYDYIADELTFRGITADQGRTEIGTSPVTLSVSKVPASADLPEGVTVEWTANKDSVTLTPSADGLSCTVAATGYTEGNINNSNNVEITATLVDSEGTPITTFESQYRSAVFPVVLTNAAPETPANPFSVVVTNGEGEEITCDPNGSTVITVPQSMAYNFSISSEDEIANFDYTTADDTIGQTNTNTIWNGTSGSYQIYAAGAVGEQVGVYVNGTKIFVMEVGDRPFESDTTLDMDLKVGQKYQFEITLDDPTASFTFQTADGAALSTSYNPDTYPAENGKYYCSVTAQQAGRDIGVYCVIDGKTYKVFTAHLVG